MVFVTESFLDGAPATNETQFNVNALTQAELVGLQNDASELRLVNLTTTACLQEFGGVYEASFDAVLLVLDNASSTTSLAAAAMATGLTWGDETALDKSQVKYCLARQAPPQSCSVVASSPLLGVVALLNLATLLSIAAVLVQSKFEPLATLGDAIRSFLRSPDSTTKGNCLLSKANVKQCRWGYDAAQHFVPSKNPWYRAPSPGRWALFIASWTALVSLTAAALASIVATDPQGFLIPFGTATPYTTHVLSTTVTRTRLALLASLPQILLAILYLTTNSLLTNYYLSHELTLFALRPRHLRVSSDPTGAQTTSLYITLPRPISWLLFSLFLVMAFVLSQAIFPSIITVSPSASKSSPIMAICLSIRAVLVLLVLLVVLAIFVVGLGFRRAPSAVVSNGQPKGNPLALEGGSCSAALSAKCHLAVPESEPWKQPVAWGVVSEGFGAGQGRCAFSSRAVESVDPGKLYS